MGQNWSTLWTGKSRAYRGHAPQASAPGLHIQDPAYDDNEELIRPENWNWTLSLSLSIWKPLELAAHKDLLLLITKLVSTTFFFVKSPWALNLKQEHPSTH